MIVLVLSRALILLSVCVHLAVLHLLISNHTSKGKNSIVVQESELTIQKACLVCNSIT